MTTRECTDIMPVLKSLSEIYSPERVPQEMVRYQNVIQRFEKEFKISPEFIARAPGRVNLIGGHIDTSGYSVFPMAIERDIIMVSAIIPEHDKPLTVRLCNIASRFEKTTFSLNYADPDSLNLVHYGPTRWANYFKTALKGLQPYLPNDAVHRAHGTLCVMVDGTVPPEASLSSSAAMTTCSSMVVLEALHARKQISRTQMTEIAIASERLVGVNSGGMDQAASVFGIRGHAMYVTFVPSLMAEPIRLPSDEYVCVVSNTLVTSDKKVMGPVQYNLRVVEKMIAAAVLTRVLNVNLDDAAVPRGFSRSLRGVIDTYWTQYPDALENMMRTAEDVRFAYNDCGYKVARLQGAMHLLEQHLPDGPLTRVQAEQLTGITGDAFEKTFLSAFPVRGDVYYPKARAQHVFSDALRVIQFRTLTDRARASVQRGEPCDVHKVYAAYGALMNSSQESLRCLYDCSSPELDFLTSLSRKHGALGSLLTGAGWGGCAIHLVHESRLPRLMYALSETYYRMRYPMISKTELDNALFVTKPAQGACILFMPVHE